MRNDTTGERIARDLVTVEFGIQRRIGTCRTGSCRRHQRSATMADPSETLLCDRNPIVVPDESRKDGLEDAVSD